MKGRGPRAQEGREREETLTHADIEAKRTRVRRQRSRGANAQVAARGGPEDRRASPIRREAAA
jgi:hypothetical protein